MNRDFLKEAIADAKAVKESAIANAKAALEESFTPHLKTMLAAKLHEMEEKEEEEGVKEVYDELEEADEMKNEAETQDEMKEPVSEMNLEELLAELEEAEEGQEEETNENLFEAEEDSDEKEEKSEETVGDISVEELEDIIADVIQDMKKSGELEMTSGEEKEEEGGEEEGEKEKMDEELEEILAEIELEEKKHNKKKESEELDEFLSEIELEEDELEEYGDEHPVSTKDALKEKESELKEAYNALKAVKAELNEVNLLNAKLLYTNKIFRSKSLTESQKVKVLSAFDKAINVKEVKLVYESLIENLTTNKKPVNENLLGSASKTISGIKTQKQPIVESNEMVKRFQKLAGII